MAKLAIKGHATRGREVIEILEMLGGKVGDVYKGDAGGCVYIINEEGVIDWRHNRDNYTVYSLEEFLEKFPYKVGDKVSSKYLKNYKIEKMEWEATNNRVIYKLQGMGWYSVRELQPYKEETIETITIDDFKANTKEWLIDKLGNMSMNDALLTINNIYNELHKPKYPKTYEACKIQIHESFGIRQILGYKFYLIEKFQQLLICRDTYWKIAGEQMGLGKPWKPDWTNTNRNKYCIYFVGDEIKKQPMLEVHHFLAFPTAEMRDTFYENFKDLIEQCKEFL